MTQTTKDGGATDLTTDASGQVRALAFIEAARFIEEMEQVDPPKPMSADMLKAVAGAGLREMAKRIAALTPAPQVDAEHCGCGDKACLACFPAATPTAQEAVIMRGLSDDADGLGRFSHHPDPAIDFCIEVETLESRLHQAENGLCKPGDKPETVAEVLADIKSAMEFTVGGDEGAVRAKGILRGLENRATPTAQEAVPVAWAKPEDIRMHSAWWVKRQPNKHHSIPLYDHPPQPGVSVAEAALKEARANMQQIKERLVGEWPRNGTLELIETHQRKIDAALCALKGGNE